MAPWRHLPAIVFDLATIAWPTAVGMVAFHERFTILPSTDGSPRFSPTDQARINEIDQIFNRGIRFGDNIFTLSGSGWWLTMLVLSMATIIVFIGVPAIMDQRTIGQRLLGMAAAPDIMTTATVIDMATPIDLSDSPAMVAPNLGFPNALFVSSDDVLDMTNIEDAEDIDDWEDIEDGDIEDEDGETELADVEVADATLEIDVTGHSEDIDVSNPDVDVTDSAPWQQVTLADENDYLEWDRVQGQAEAAPAPAATMTQARPIEGEPEVETVVEPGVEAVVETKVDLETAPDVSQVPNQEASGITVDSPEWSADWNAWMFWDPKTRRWYKHETDSNRWSPVS